MSRDARTGPDPLPGQLELPSRLLEEPALTSSETQRVRVRKRRQAPKKARHTWLWLPVVGGLVLLGAIAGGLFLRDALVVRDSLRATQASLAQVMEAAGDVDVEQASTELDRADEELATARSRSRGPLWALAARVPVVGADVRTTQGSVELASAAVAVAEVAIEDGEQLVSRGLDIAVDDGRLDLAPLLEAAELLEALPVARLADARDDLAALEPSPFAPDELVSGRAEAISLADRALGTIGNGQALLSAMPGFLGTDEPRSYFLGVQTPSELRGTGGMIGYWAVLTVDDGHFELTRSAVYDPQDDLDDPVTGRIGDLSGDTTQGAAVDEEFRERYEHVAAAGLFSNVNVDPDLPTTAEVLLDLFEVRTGDRLDGVVLLDPIAMQVILSAVGADLEVPEQAVAEGVPETLPADEFAKFALVDVYEHFGQGRGEDRKLLLRGLGDAAFARVFDGAWDGVAVGQAIGGAASSRNLQVHSRDEDEQRAFEELDVAGELRAPEGADLLAVTANNAVGGKQDVHVGHRVTAALDLAEPGRTGDEVSVSRRGEVRVETDNPLPSTGMDTYIIGACERTRTSDGCFDGPPGQNRTWYSVWTPGSSNLVDSSADDAPGGVNSGRLRGLRVFDRFVTAPSQERSGFELTYNGRAPARVDADGSLVYVLGWWAQAKGIPTQLSVTITPPEGWRVVDLEVDGGGEDAPALFGPDEALNVEEMADGSARVTGTVRGDTTLSVRMAGA